MQEGVRIEHSGQPAAAHIGVGIDVQVLVSDFHGRRLDVGGVHAGTHVPEEVFMVLV